MKLTSKKILQLYNNSKVVKTAKELSSVYKNRDKRFPISFDTETTSETFNTISYLYLNDNDIKKVHLPFCFGISMAIISKGIVHLLWARDNSLFRAACMLLGKKGLKTAHNARYDIRVLEENHAVVPVAPDVDCTYTMARIYWDRRKKHSLKALAEILCPELSGWDEPVKSELRKLRTQYTRQGFTKDYVNYSFVPDKIMSKYSSLDSFWGLVLWIYLREKAIW